MSAVGTAAAIAVGASLVVAGVSKLARPAWTADAAGLGVPRSIARPVPVVELVVGSLLCFGVARRPLAWVAVALLVAFTIVLARPVLRGQRPVCACFGALTSRPAGPLSLVRNAVLIASAVVAALVR
jgi:uncharacterized membrane protein YphA (DoxX/SURF4 family)